LDILRNLPTVSVFVSGKKESVAVANLDVNEEYKFLRDQLFPMWLDSSVVEFLLWVSHSHL
jgi:hypothetical protein